MNVLATAAQMRELDRVSIEERGIPSLELMENAAAASVDELHRLVRKHCKGRVAGSIGIIMSRKDGQPLQEEELAQKYKLQEIVESKNQETQPRIAVFCGPGNNGGDGVAAARLLGERGYHVRAFLVGKREDMTPDCRAMEEKLIASGITLEKFDPEDILVRTWVLTCDGIMDALFGVGLNRAVGGDFKTAIEWINRVSNTIPVVSCDIPSGLHADTGAVMGVAVKAWTTVTFSCAKPGLYLNEGRAYSGEVKIVDIGIPGDLIHEMIYRVPERMEVYPDYADFILPTRPRTAHKGDFGKVFILAGSEGFTGAPVLCANGAVRMGAGLVFLGVSRDIYPIVAVKCDEAMPFPLPEDYETLLSKAKGCDVAVIGPGLGQSHGARELVRRLLRDLEIPVVLDADGINALQGHIDTLDGRTAPTVLTPHDGEFQRLTGCALPLQDRLGAARSFAKAHNCVLVLKGHTTITASPDGRTILNACGNPGMAKGGCGDVLAGMLGGLLGQKHLRNPYTKLAEQVACGVWYHGKVGDLCAKELGEYGMTPSDMLQKLPGFLKTQEQRERDD